MSAFENLKSMTGDDFIREMIQTFLDDTPQQITAIQAALESGDVDSFRRAAHSIKSNAANFGADQLAGLASELERLGRQSQLEGVAGRLEVLEEAYRVAATELRELRP